MAPRRRMGRSSATAVRSERDPKRGFQPPTKRPNRKGHQNIHKLRLLLDFAEPPPRHLEFASDPALRLRGYTVDHPRQMFSIAVKPTKSNRAFLQGPSLSRILIWRQDFIQSPEELWKVSQIVASIALCIGQHHQKPRACLPGDISIFIEIPHGISAPFVLLQDLD